VIHKETSREALLGWLCTISQMPISATYLHNGGEIIMGDIYCTSAQYGGRYISNTSHTVLLGTMWPTCTSVCYSILCIGGKDYSQEFSLFWRNFKRLLWKIKAQIKNLKQLLCACHRRCYGQNFSLFQCKDKAALATGM